MAFLLIGLLFGQLIFGILLALGAGVIGFILPEMWLGRRIKKRRKAILMAVPDTLDLLTISVRA
ncbi:hypothetical protein BH18CHL1_BH18CHL1_09980 [soil metagenome]